MKELQRASSLLSSQLGGSVDVVLKIILDEQHLRSVLTEFVKYYNLQRPHRTLRLETPVPALRAMQGSVRSRPVLGGLHHVYERAA